MLATATAVQAEKTQYESIIIMAEDVNCRQCHTITPHEIHVDKPVDCSDCHGTTLSIAIPQCTKCHTGSIHNVHIGIVKTEDCSYCHSNVNTFHTNMISNTVCSHCHGDPVTVHGGPKVGCQKCHDQAPDIAKPVKAQGTTVICQNCHTAADVTDLHGTTENRSSCYRCHRPGSTKIMSISEIPHSIHIPKVECNTCHFDQQTGKVTIPSCTKCHSVDQIHAFDAIGLKTPDHGLSCAACHAVASAAESVTTTLSETPAGSESEAEDSGLVETTAAQAEDAAVETPATEKAAGMPGFGVLTALISLSVVYLARRIKK